MSRIETTFEQLKRQGKKALILFITAGDPEPARTVPLMHALAAAGADIIELGVPFSDPMADGPTIQRASERALKHGVSLKDVLEITAEFRRQNHTTPVVLMGYANPIAAMGEERFAAAAAACGVDGVLTVDYPPEECAGFVEILKRHGIDPIFLLAPTSSKERMRQVAQLGRGFIYYVSLKGVTGAFHIDLAEVKNKVPEIRALTDLPIGVGFGVRDAESAKAIAAFADAVVVASRLIEEMTAAGEGEMEYKVSRLAQDLRRALDNSSATQAAGKAL